MNEQELQKQISELQNGNDQQRRAASYKLGKSKNPAAVPALVSAYNDADGSVRQNVFDGLRSIGSKEALDFLASHKENDLNVLPTLDSKTIMCDSKGIVTIKPMPILTYVLVAIIGLFSIGLLVRGALVLGIGGIIGGVLTYLLARNSGAPLELNPITRIFKIGTDPRSVNIPFDDIAGFGVMTEKEAGNFTEEKIMVMLKDGRGINIGVITDANKKKRQEKVSNMMIFLYESTGIVLNVNDDNQAGVEKNLS